jgi:hypothetical protein
LLAGFGATITQIPTTEKKEDVEEKRIVITAS